MATAPYYLTATANVGPSAGGEVRSVLLTAGSDAATATVREGGSGGTIIAAVKAAANTSAQARFDRLAYVGQLHVTLAGTGPVATVEL